MSVKLEQDGLYMLPNGLDGRSDLILRATQTSDGWQLVECHGLPFGSEQFKARASLPAEQLRRYTVETSGALLQDSTNNAAQPTDFSMANLSLIGYLRGGTFIPPEEGL